MQLSRCEKQPHKMKSRKKSKRHFYVAAFILSSLALSFLSLVLCFQDLGLMTLILYACIFPDILRTMVEIRV
jgi:hypothetical protein